MSSTFTFYVENPPVNILTRVTDLTTKINADLDLTTVTLISCIYSNITQIITIIFNTNLSSLQTSILINLVKINIFDAVVDVDVYVSDFNNTRRTSYKTANKPTANHDINSGYTEGSHITTNSNHVYVCTDDTANNAVWKMVSMPEASFSQGILNTQTVSLLNTPTTIVGWKSANSVYEYNTGPLDPITGIVTIPTTGKYTFHVTIKVQANANSTLTDVQMVVNNIDTIILYEFDFATNLIQTMCRSVDVNLAETDTVQLQIVTSNGPVDVLDTRTFWQMNVCCPM
jgi:hypothetical protein